VPKRTAERVERRRHEDQHRGADRRCGRDRGHRVREPDPRPPVADHREQQQSRDRRQRDPGGRGGFEWVDRVEVLPRNGGVDDAGVRRPVHLVERCQDEYRGAPTRPILGGGQVSSGHPFQGAALAARRLAVERRHDDDDVADPIRRHTGPDDVARARREEAHGVIGFVDPEGERGPRS